MEKRGFYAKRFLEKHFTDQIDYAIVFFPKEELLRNQLGGRPKETILLTVDCFKNFCMIASTPKAKIIRSYYIKMENIMHEYYKNFKTKNYVLQNALERSVKETAIKHHELLIESNKNKWTNHSNQIEEKRINLVAAIVSLCKKNMTKLWIF